MGLFVFTKQGSTAFPKASSTYSASFVSSSNSTSSKGAGNGNTYYSAENDYKGQTMRTYSGGGTSNKYSYFDTFSSSETQIDIGKYRANGQNNGWVSDFNAGSQAFFNDQTQTANDFEKKASRMQSFDASSNKENFGQTVSPDGPTSNSGTSYSISRTTATPTTTTRTFKFLNQKTSSKASTKTVNYTSIDLKTVNASFTKDTYGLKSEPYYYTFTTTNTTADFSISETPIKSYSTTQSSYGFTSGNDEVQTNGDGSTTVSSTYGKHYLPDYVLINIPNNSREIVEDCIIWTFDQDKTGVYSDCFNTAGRSVVYTVKYSTKSIGIDFETITKNENDTSTSNSSSSSSQATKTESYNFPWGEGVGGNAENEATISYSYYVGISDQTSGSTLTLGPYAIMLTFTENGAKTTTIQNNFSNVAFHKDTFLIYKDDNYTTATAKIPKNYLTTVASTITWPAYKVFHGSYTTSGAASTETGGTAQIDFSNIWTTWSRGSSFSSSSASGFGLTNGFSDNSSAASYFSLRSLAYKLTPGYAVIGFYEKLPSGFLGFAGSVENSKLTDIQTVYTTFKTSSSSSGTQKFFKLEKEFSLSEHPELFYLMRPGCSVIVPKITSFYEHYTLYGNNVKDLTTSVEFSAHYSTTTKTTVSVRTSTISNYTITGLTKKRDNTNVQKGTTFKVSSYKSYTSISTTTNSKSTISAAYQISLDGKLTKNFYTSFELETPVGVLGAFGGLGATTLSIAHPAAFYLTLEDSKGRTSKSEKTLSNLTEERSLTIAKDKIMYYEMHDLYTSVYDGSDGVGGVFYFTQPKYYIEE